MPDNLTTMQTYSRSESIICSNIIVDLDADSKKATLHHVRNLHVNVLALIQKDICAVRKWISESGIDGWSVHPSQQLFAHNTRVQVLWPYLISSFFCLKPDVEDATLFIILPPSSSWNWRSDLQHSLGKWQRCLLNNCICMITTCRSCQFYCKSNLIRSIDLVSKTN